MVFLTALMTPGVKKQACVYRKCLLMQPRDDDGEVKLTRKRVCCDAPATAACVLAAL